MNNNIKILYLITFIILVYESCAPAVHVEGLYTNVFVKGIVGEEFKFTREPDTFEYDSRTEGVIKKYSIGTWEQNRKTIFLNGFTDKNINLLDVESNVEDFHKETRSKIIVQYNDAPFDPFTKVELVLNEHSKVRIPGDTAFFPDQKIRTIQVKSFLVHEDCLFSIADNTLIYDIR